jgi:hypothetical protein
MYPKPIRMKALSARTALFIMVLPLLTTRAWAQCHYIPSTSVAGDTVSFTATGGGFASFGCAPIDPTYWLDAPGANVLMTYVEAQEYPAIRVWGMNTDDSASIEVNDADYPMDLGSAYSRPKVVCGLSPGPDGVEFANGLIVGANTPGEGNYSYSDVVLNSTGVTSIRITYRGGAGWGFAGVLLDCAAEVEENAAFTGPVFFDPATSLLRLSPANGSREVWVTNGTGALVKRVAGAMTAVDLSELSPGCYVVTLVEGDRRKAMRVVIL